MGLTGSGKTLLVETLAKSAKLPFVVADANSLTQTGYVGDDIETIITRLLAQCEGDQQKAERAVVFLDEVDKIAKRGQMSTGGGSGGLCSHGFPFFVTSIRYYCSS